MEKKRSLAFILVFITVFGVMGVMCVPALSQSAAPSSEMAEEGGRAAQVSKEKEEAEKVKAEAEAAKEQVEKARLEAESARKEAEIEKKAAEIDKKKLEAEIKETKVVKKEAVIAQKTANGTEKAAKAVEKARQEEAEDKMAREKAYAAEEKMLAAQQKALLAEEEMKLSQMRLALAVERIKEQDLKRGFAERLFESAGIIFLGVLFFLILRIGVKKFEKVLTKKDTMREREFTVRVRTAVKTFNWMGSLAICVSVLYMILEKNGLSVAPLLAGAGLVGIAFGFGGQYLIRDIINGLFILIEGQYRINDVVKIGEYCGLVEDINLRITTLRDLEGRVIIIPNGEVKVVVNYTKDYSQALFDIGIAYKEDVDRVMKVVRRIGEEMRKDDYFGKLIIGDMEMFGVDAFADSAVIIKFRMKTLPIKQWEVKREFHRRLKNRFDEMGIEIPFPHRTLYWGTGAEPEAAAKPREKSL